MTATPSGRRSSKDWFTRFGAAAFLSIRAEGLRDEFLGALRYAAEVATGLQPWVKLVREFSSTDVVARTRLEQPLATLESFCKTLVVPGGQYAGLREAVNAVAGALAEECTQMLREVRREETKRHALLYVLSLFDRWRKGQPLYQGRNGLAQIFGVEQRAVDAWVDWGIERGFVLYHPGTHGGLQNRPIWISETGIDVVDELLAEEQAGNGMLDGAPVVQLRSLLTQKGMLTVVREFDRASAPDADSGTVVTAACAAFEAYAKHYIHREGLTMPAKQEVASLWRVMQKELRLDPASETDTDLRQMLTGLASVLHGVAAYRTHAGSAHGRAPEQHVPGGRHARLAINASSTLVLFLLEEESSRGA
jgi:hypothetical protein